MQLSVNYSAVETFNDKAPTLATRSFKIGKHAVTLEAIVDAYYTFNTRVGLNGAKPSFHGDLDWKTNGIGERRLWREQDRLLEEVAKATPLHGPAFGLRHRDPYSGFSRGPWASYSG
jgi:hypothetical protein